MKMPLECGLAFRFFSITSNFVPSVARIWVKCSSIKREKVNQDLFWYNKINKKLKSSAQHILRSTLVWSWNMKIEWKIIWALFFFLLHQFPGRLCFMSHYKPINNDKQRAPRWDVRKQDSRQLWQQAPAAETTARLNVHTGGDTAHSRHRGAQAQCSALIRTARCRAGRDHGEAESEHRDVRLANVIRWRTCKQTETKKKLLYFHFLSLFFLW